MDPVAPETRRVLARAWERLPAPLRLPNQFLGRHYAGCAATVGLMPRCDFSCRGCYLGEGANTVLSKPLAEIKAQLRVIRDWLGPAGNLQLTDGEVTLRPEPELREIIAYARSIGLVPMLMTHGESFRRRPGLLERLMQAGLSEVSFHVDSTMRSRAGAKGRDRSEEELNSLRGEFADRVRAARRATGLPLEAASTMTVHRRNLDAVPSVVHWFMGNADAFKIASFLPVARVGRTEALESVSAEELWQRLCAGAGLDLLRSEGFLGHPACNRFAQGVVVRRVGKAPAFHPLYRTDVPREVRLLTQLFDRLGGASFRLDTRPQAAARALKMAARHPGFLLGRMLPYAWGLLKRVGEGNPWRLILELLLERTELHYFNIISHHFMSREEAESPLGRERLAACAFQAPIQGKLRPMCEINAFGLRQDYYANQSWEFRVQS